MSAMTRRRSAIVRGAAGAASLRIGAGIARTDHGAACKSPGVEQREVHRRLALGQPLRHEAARRGRVLEAVAAEADGQEDSLDARRPADDRVIVGSEGPKPRPAAGDARALDDRQAANRLVDRLLALRAAHRDGHVVADVLDIAWAQQDLLHLLPEIEPARASVVSGTGPGSSGHGSVNNR